MGNIGETNSWPRDAEQAALMARVRRSDSTALLGLLLNLVASGEWHMFAVAMAEVSDISARGVKVLLEPTDVGPQWNHLYRAAGLPPQLLVLFLEILRMSLASRSDAGIPAVGPERRLFFVNNVLAEPGIRALNISGELLSILTGKGSVEGP